MKVLTVPEVAKLLRLGDEKVRRELRAGRLRGSKLGEARTNYWRIPEAAVNEYLDRYSNTAVPAPVRRRRTRRRAS